MNKTAMKPIGSIQTPFTEIENMPIQPKGAKDLTGTAVLNAEYANGLQDL